MSNVLLGLQTVISPMVLLFLLLGCVVGLVIGALPGLTGNMAIALMVPLTFGMEPSVGLAFLSAIYCSSIYGGSISAILLGIPGTISMMSEKSHSKALEIFTKTSVVILAFLPSFASEAVLISLSSFGFVRFHSYSF